MRTLFFLFALWLALSGAALAVVNINTATKEELTTLKGVGEKRAQDILDYRKKHGSFKSVDDLEKVPSIGPGLMKQIRSNLTVTGKTSIDKTKAGDKGKSATAKTAAPPKGDPMKAETAKSKSAEKSK